MVGKLFIIQYLEGPELRAQAQREAVKEKSIKANRGNIYSADDKLIATSIPVYNLYMDPVTVDTKIFHKLLPELSQKLASQFSKRNAQQWEDYLRIKRDKGIRYVPLARYVSYTQLQQIHSFPIFSLGRFKGGLIFEQQDCRKMLLGKLAERTIGYNQPKRRTGIEDAFNSYLSGQDGKRLMQKLSKGNWRPIADHYEIEPQDGLDVVTTIDTKIQDIVHHELLRALEQFEADHGCAVVMEVETGAIRGIANLGRTEQGTYFEKRNYAVWESTEPGSTFKLASIIVALEDGIVDTSTQVDTENGLFTIYDKQIKDSNHKNDKGGYGKISLKKAFELSSNVGIVKIIYDNYRHQPDRFIDRFYTLGIHKPLGVPIKGESLPKIPKTSDRNWSGITLPWIAFGYQVSFTPLQLLTFYNAIANEGKMVKPLFIEEVRKNKRIVKKEKTHVINPAICSKQTLEKIRDMLEGVVEDGTAKDLKNSLVKLAGKTGTCQQNYWKEASRDYQASFVGYFPAENPKYSCIVVINKPNYIRGYYASAVAAPVFKAIAQSIYLNTPSELKSKRENNFLLAMTRNQEQIQIKNKFPDLKDVSGYKVLSLLENQGYKVKIRGNGKVMWQYPPAGTKINTSALIELKLE